MLVGRKVRLRALESADYPLLARWYNDPDVMQYWGHPGETVSVEEVIRREEAQRSPGSSRKYIIETRDAVPIGQIDYYDLDWRQRTASVSIMIAEPEYWGGGYGTDAMWTLLEYLFRQAGLHRVSLNVHASNPRAQRSYEKSGFRAEGVMRDWAYFNGQWVDGILMAILAPEFEELARTRSGQPSEA